VKGFYGYSCLITKEKTNMSTKPCKKCGEQVSTGAKNCPHCDVKYPHVSKKATALVLFVMSVLLVVIIGMVSKDTPAEARIAMIERHFSSWDGSHMGLTAMIKKNMNEPGSYEHDNTRYLDNGDHLIVITSFRGKNAFGGVVKNSVRAKVDLEGNVVAILKEGP
jgi:hypothetical protein